MIGRVILVVFLLGGGYWAYEYQRYGYFDLPEMPDGSFPITFGTDFRAVMVGLDDVRPDRNYVAKPATVPDWLKKVWSFCEKIPQEDQPALEQVLTLGQRLEAICTIDVDGEKVVRGIIVSRPNL